MCKSAPVSIAEFALLPLSAGGATLALGARIAEVPATSDWIARAAVAVPRGNGSLNSATHLARALPNCSDLVDEPLLFKGAREAGPPTQYLEEQY